jgi:predicted unusual protein kinase regulating ubiquinone biosynthesis (AarF/ABC1/UbiB family)
MPQDHPTFPRRVPAGRLARGARIGALATGLAGGALAEGLRRLARGERPGVAEAMLNAPNARRLTGGLAQLRGAAMKLGQMLSLDAGMALPAELEAILAQLRASAPAMPPAQLKRVLIDEWGGDWHRRFARFDVTPIAAASIGQVHRAQTRDGRDLAIKVQFPGVRASIDSDIANLGTLLRLAGVVPSGLDLAPLLDQTRAQLHAEADYRQEARALTAFRGALADTPDFRVPRLHDDLSTARVLAMDHICSDPIETLAEARQDLRDRTAGALIDLVLRELFEIKQMQTDPNFANYRVEPGSGRIVLLDFGATRTIDPVTAARYRTLLGALLDGDGRVMSDEMLALGYFPASATGAETSLILGMAEHAAAPLRQAQPYDFGQTTLPLEIAEMGRPLGGSRKLWHIPPAELLFLHRKIAGMFLLAQRLRARVALRPRLERWRCSP